MRPVLVKLPKRRGELLYGIAPCLAALQAKRRKIYSIFTQNGFNNGDKKRHLKELLTSRMQEHSKKTDTKITSLSNSDIVRLVGKKPHQGIVLDAEQLTFKTSQLTSVIESNSKLPGLKAPLWLLLYQIQDPMNFGAILRCAYFLDIDKVLVTSRNSCGLTPVVSKASAGAMELLQVHSVEDTALMLKHAVSFGWTVLGACSTTDNKQLPVVSCGDAKLNGRPTILIMGNEGCGLPREIARVCTSAITIPSRRPLPPGFDSLNVSVATGILLQSLKP